MCLDAMVIARYAELPGSAPQRPWWVHGVRVDHVNATAFTRVGPFVQASGGLPTLPCDAEQGTTVGFRRLGRLGLYSAR